MPSNTKKQITFSVESPKHKQYIRNIAIEKGFKSEGDMARYALSKMFTSMKVPFLPDDSFTGRDGL